MEQHELILLAASSERIKVPQNTLLLSQGEKGKHVYFVRSGLVKIARKVAFLPIKMYYKTEGGNYGGQRQLNQEETREVFRIDPMEAKYSQ